MIDGRQTYAGLGGRCALFAFCCMNKPMPLRLAASCVLCDPDRDRHTEACHPVDHVACDLRFSPLTGQNPSVETPANDGLVAIHRGLNQAPTAVARTALPGDASMLRYRRQMSVPPLPHPQHQSREAGSCLGRFRPSAGSSTNDCMTPMSAVQPVVSAPLKQTSKGDFQI